MSALSKTDGFKNFRKMVEESISKPQKSLVVKLRNDVTNDEVIYLKNFLNALTEVDDIVER